MGYVQEVELTPGSYENNIIDTYFRNKSGSNMESDFSGGSVEARGCNRAMLRVFELKK